MLMSWYLKGKNYDNCGELSEGYKFDLGRVLPWKDFSIQDEISVVAREK
jgi:hypothetical protein